MGLHANKSCYTPILLSVRSNHWPRMPWLCWSRSGPFTAFIHRARCSTRWLLLPAIPIIGIIAVVGLYLAEEKDEFQRNLLIQSMLWGLGQVESR